MFWSSSRAISYWYSTGNLPTDVATGRDNDDDDDYDDDDDNEVKKHFQNCLKLHNMKFKLSR